MDYLCDYHTHSINSADAKYSVMEICRAAVEKELAEVAITDHFESENEMQDYGQYKPDIYWRDIQKARDRYKGRIKIKTGVEIGQPHWFQKISERLLNSYPYDYVIGSLHRLSDNCSLYTMDYSTITLDKLCETYLKDLYNLAAGGNYDCIGHLDLIKRYSIGYYKTKITLMSHRDLLQEVLKKIIFQGKGIEINTSGLRQGPKETMPGLDVIKLYKSLGGEVLTIGSDAHNTCDVGEGIKEGIELAKEAGFKYITLFNNRLPEWRKIGDRTEFYGMPGQ